MWKNALRESENGVNSLPAQGFSAESLLESELVERIGKDELAVLFLRQAAKL